MKLKDVKYEVMHHIRGSCNPLVESWATLPLKVEQLSETSCAACMQWVARPSVRELNI